MVCGLSLGEPQTRAEQRHDNLQEELLMCPRSDTSLQPWCSFQSLQIPPMTVTPAPEGEHGLPFSSSQMCQLV